MKKKVMSVILAASMAASMLGGCGKEEARKTTSDGKADTSEHVVLKMYCIGDEGGAIAQDHLDKLNEVLTEKINAEIEPVMVSWGEYKTKLPLVWASGEAYDLTYTSNWSGYFSEGAKGAFMDITELLPEYAPKTYEELKASGRLENTLINDKVYMVPNDKPEYTSNVILYREDLRKKYNCPEIVDHETFETYMDAIVENEPEMLPWADFATDTNRTALFLNEMDWSRAVEGGKGVLVYDIEEGKEVFNMVETPEFEEFVKKSREYYEKGYWSQSIMAETATTKEKFIAGTSAVYASNMSNCNGAYQSVQASSPDWEVGVFPSDYLLSDYTESVTVSNNGMAIGAYSENPERAMMFIELCYQDEDVYHLVVDGLEGVTYEMDAETMEKWTPEGADPSTLTLKNIGMGFGCSKFWLTSRNDHPQLRELEQKYEEKKVFPALDGFSFNQENVSAEVAAVAAAYDEYLLPLVKGTVDPEKGLETLRQQMKAAGVDKVMEEANKQIAEFNEKRGNK